MDKVCEMGLRNWRNLNAVICTLDEAQVMEMFSHEMMHGQRHTFIKRLMQRHDALTEARERAEKLMGRAA